jgi:hypothetical protein
MSYRVKDWPVFQHYKKRRPTWIKLYRWLLDDYKFQRLPDASRALAPMLWLLASERAGEVSDNPEEISFRVGQSPSWVEEAIKPLVEQGFLIRYQDASSALADGYQVATPETETETETETEHRVQSKSEIARFAPPTPEEVDAHIREKGYGGFTGRKFCAHYASKGWKIGKGPMKDWRQACITWDKGEATRHEEIKPNPEAEAEYQLAKKHGWVK